jgi:2-polyprenyl-3-methyl-5-hydroxy-6-metoxy-1,4-benzoquinol methylase
VRVVKPEPGWPESWRLSAAYDALEIYDGASDPGYSGIFRTRFQATLDLITKALPPGSEILDIAAAQGNFSLALAERGYRVTWNDLREDLVPYVELKHERGELSFAPGNAFDLGFDDRFDGVLIAEVIEHVAHPDVFLANASRLVKPGGIVVMTTPNGAYFRNRLPRFSDCVDPARFESMQFKPNADGHIFLLHPDEVRRLAERAHLELEEFRLFTNPLTAGHLKTDVLLKVLPRQVVDAIERTSQRLRFAREQLFFHQAARFRRTHPI